MKYPGINKTNNVPNTILNDVVIVRKGARINDIIINEMITASQTLNIFSIIYFKRIVFKSFLIM